MRKTSRRLKSRLIAGKTVVRNRCGVGVEIAKEILDDEGQALRQMHNIEPAAACAKEANPQQTDAGPRVDRLRQYHPPDAMQLAAFGRESGKYDDRASAARSAEQIELLDAQVIHETQQMFCIAN